MHKNSKTEFSDLTSRKGVVAALWGKPIAQGGLEIFDHCGPKKLTNIQIIACQIHQLSSFVQKDPESYSGIARVGKLSIRSIFRHGHFCVLTLDICELNAISKCSKRSMEQFLEHMKEVQEQGERLTYQRKVSRLQNPPINLPSYLPLTAGPCTSGDPVTRHTWTPDIPWNSPRF